MVVKYGEAMETPRSGGPEEEPGSSCEVNGIDIAVDGGAMRPIVCPRCGSTAPLTVLADATLVCPEQHTFTNSAIVPETTPAALRRLGAVGSPAVEEEGAAP